MLNTLLLVALWLEWRRTRSWLIIVIAFGSIAKAVIEVSLGASIVTHISWPPYAWSHVAGLIGGLMIVWGQSRNDKKSGDKPAAAQLYFLVTPELPLHIFEIVKK